MMHQDSVTITIFLYSLVWVGFSKVVRFLSRMHLKNCFELFTNHTHALQGIKKLKPEKVKSNC